MRIEFTGASLAIIAVTALAAKGLKQDNRSGSASADSESQLQRQRSRIDQAERRVQMPFNRWVRAVEHERGRPLTQGDPLRPTMDAYQGETWYDVWLDGVSPPEAARMGSRAIV